MAAPLTSIRLDKKLADRARKILGAKSRTEAVPMALEEVVKLQEFKEMMRKNEGKLAFANFEK